jgi:hypothetical protein
MTTTARRVDRARRRFLRRACGCAATATLGPLLLTERTIAQIEERFTAWLAS